MNFMSLYNNVYKYNEDIQGGKHFRNTDSRETVGALFLPLRLNKIKNAIDKIYCGVYV